MTDEELYQNYKQGDIEAFAELYKRYAGRVHLLGQKYLAREVVTAWTDGIFLQLHRSRHSYDPQYSLAQWLFVLCCRELPLSLSAPESMQTVLTAHDAEGFAQEMSRAHRELDEKDFHLLETRFVNGLAFEEILGRLEAADRFWGANS